jgi:hypothetical protein
MAEVADALGLLIANVFPFSDGHDVRDPWADANSGEKDDNSRGEF